MPHLTFASSPFDRSSRQTLRILRFVAPPIHSSTLWHGGPGPLDLYSETQISASFIICACYPSSSALPNSTAISTCASFKPFTTSLQHTRAPCIPARASCACLQTAPCDEPTSGPAFRRDDPRSIHPTVACSRKGTRHKAGSEPLDTRLRGHCQTAHTSPCLTRNELRTRHLCEIATPGTIRYDLWPLPWDEPLPRQPRATDRQCDALCAPPGYGPDERAE